MIYKNSSKVIQTISTIFKYLRLREIISRTTNSQKKTSNAIRLQLVFTNVIQFEKLCVCIDKFSGQN